jgi:hypothetical protein
MKLLLFVVCAISLAASSLAAHGEDRVSGKFTVKGKTTEFHHVYAFWKPRLMDESKVDLYVLLSDEAVSTDTLPKDDEGVSKMAALVRDDKIHALELHFEFALRVELKDIVVDASAWWDGEDLLIEQSLRNLSPVPVSFNAFCQPPERAQLEAAFLDVPAGQVRTRAYRLPAAHALAGSRLWMGIAEIGGRRTLDQLVSIPR